MASKRPVVWKSPDEVRAWEQELHRRGQRLALVPTMGFLHEGHLSLMREGARARRRGGGVHLRQPDAVRAQRRFVALPARHAEGDLAKLRERRRRGRVHARAQYRVPSGYQTYVDVEHVSQGLCGDKRPGHFRGVATVVTKLLALFRPHVALFGEKDYQQLQVIKRSTPTSTWAATIVGMPTVREVDGLAMSSRNSVPVD